MTRISLYLPSSPATSKRRQSAFIAMIFTDNLIPVLTDGILEEYGEVLRRKKFGFPEESISTFLEEFAHKAIRVTPHHADIALSDEKDRPFLEAMLADTEAVLITGNMKHFPKHERIMTARDFIDRYCL